MSASLVGSEMCIRDRDLPDDHGRLRVGAAGGVDHAAGDALEVRVGQRRAVSYTHLTLPTICSV
eukprot:13151773-Alexandrium_andersonii.AAC.1